MRMEVLLGIHGVWDVVDLGLVDAKNNNFVKGLLFQSVPEDLVLQIRNLKIGKEMWEAIKTPKIREVMSEHKLVKKFLTSIPRWFFHIVVALEQVLDLKMKRFEDVVGQLKAYEERVKEEDKANDPQKNLLYARTEYSNRNNDSSGGRGNYYYFFELNGNITGRVRFGDGSCVSINGKGSILFQGKNREQKMLKDVYYVPALRSNVISLGQATISGYDINIRGDYLTMRDSWGSLLIKVPRSANRLYKAQLKVGKEDTNEVGRESGTFTDLCNDIHENGTNQVIHEEANLYSSSVTVYSPVYDIILETGKGWKIHHLDVKKDFQHGDMKLYSTLKEMGFLQCVQEKAVCRKVPNGGLIIVAVYGDDIFMTGASLDLINEFNYGNQSCTQQ
uniref:Retrovirus-related Pol polyprotein from transposon TNT 1-94-like beta-barrel domain-containing protein n=1 Tax=Tanacetum cinerariifolium TaxID=118510 RepID=A0A699GHJ0_TANCI|nr:hypothetical protein [Tanacetum cinerariifolium]